MEIENVITRIFKKLPADIVAIAARLAIASVFWRSAQTKISGWDFLDQSWQFYNLSQSTMVLFEYEYNLPLINYKIAAYLATFNEFFLSIAILIGFMTRLTAFGFLAMTTVIQIFVYPDAWPTHILWVAILLYLIKNGAGQFSLDYLLFQKK